MDVLKSIAGQYNVVQRLLSPAAAFSPFVPLDTQRWAIIFSSIVDILVSMEGTTTPGEGLIFPANQTHVLNVRDHGPLAQSSLVCTVAPANFITVIEVVRL